MKRLIIGEIARMAFELFLFLALAATSADLLYLYACRKWHDPNQVIETCELAMLTLFILLSIGWSAWRYRCWFIRSKTGSGTDAS